MTHLGVTPHLHLRKRNLRRDYRPTLLALINCNNLLPRHEVRVAVNTQHLAVDVHPDKTQTSVGKTSGWRTTQLAKMSIDSKFMELTADVFSSFFQNTLHTPLKIVLT